ncbi:glycosyltransferase [Halomonas korlensis]|uniref:Glycosyltransferase, GT2 family n=1 Tax=Halomonas korlensis TaxID=463301 RepID=A0A1I7G461_9GAMM|nr:glycosyltransferase [Halomonas korlensis]SFU43275.1 Glycosyltransferase, GT2 family [Halomonas korlensis]
MPEQKHRESAANPIRLAAVVVSFNRIEYLKQAVCAVLDEPVCGLVVVDNGSTDGSREWLAALDEARLIVLTPERNLGGAGGFEIGFREVLERFSPDWLVCFDDDARPAPGALAQFMAQDLQGVDSAAAAVFYPDGSICEMNRPSWNPFWHGRLLLRTILGVTTGRSREGFHIPDGYYRKDADRVAIDSSSFVGCFVSAEAVRRIGLPRGELFIYGDDIIYTLMLSRSGGRHMFLPNIHFVHDCSTFSNNVVAYAPLWKAYYTYRNGLVMYRIAAGPWFALVVPIKVLGWLFAVRHYDDKRRYLKLWWTAVSDALRGRTRRSHDELVKRYS